VADGGSGQRPRDFRTLVEDVKALATVLAMEAESVFGRRTALFLGILSLSAVVVGTLLYLLDWYIDPRTSTEKKDLVQALGLLTVGTAGAVGIFFTWRGQRHAREAQQNTQKNTQEQLEQTRRGQITERFTRAIDQLGATEGEVKNMEVRLGGIYSLERTAREDQDYHWPIMEVLTTYVRKHAPRREAEKPNAEDVLTPEPDIQAILTVIGRRSKHHKDVEHGPIDLRGARLRGADLQGADLNQSALQGARLRGARLQEASLNMARLQGAYLQEADLRGANFLKARLKGANLLKADLQYANLREANLREVKVTDEQLAKTLSLQGATMPDGSEHP
jgi:hypothetical protein